MFKALKGICAAPLLPMKLDCSIDWESLKSYIGWVARQRPAAIAMNMGASEGEVLSLDERLKVIAFCREVIGEDCLFFSGVVVGAVADAVAEAPRLIDAGADGLVVFPRFPYRPARESDIVDLHRAIADAVDRPIIAFQLPRDIGPDFTAAVLKSLSEIPQLVAVKEASFDLTHTRSTVQAVARLERPVGVLTGTDTAILEAMMIGCDGAFIGFAATATAELVAMHAAVEKEDFETAWRIWERLGPLAKFSWRAPLRDYRPRMKEVLMAQGLISHSTVRPPQRDIDDAERIKLRELALAAGLVTSPQLEMA